MNWAAMGAISEFLAALFFLLSFSFVGLQLKQNREMQRSSHQREILNSAREFFAITRSSPEALKAVSVCMKDYADSTQAEKHIFSTWMIDFMLLVEQAWYMQRDGYINRASFAGFEGMMLAILATDGGMALWPTLKGFWGQDAATHFELLLAERQGSIPKYHELMPYL